MANILAKTLVNAPLAWCELTYADLTYAPLPPEDAVSAVRLGGLDRTSPSSFYNFPLRLL